MTRRRGWALAALLLLAGAAAWVWLMPGDAPGRLLTRLLLRQDHTWQGMVSRGVWRVGLDPSFPPFEMLDEAGQPVGFDVDLARRIAAAWGMEAEIVPIGYDSLLDALRAGKIDSVVSALPYDPRATRDYWFSPAYFEAGVRLVVRHDSPLAAVAEPKPEQLAGQRVAVEWGSMGDMVGRRLQRQGITLVLAPFETPDAAVAALAGTLPLTAPVGALLIDQVSLRAAQGQGAAFVAVGPALESNPYVIAAPLRAATLHEQLTETLAQFQTDGVLADLEARWFGALAE